MTGSCCLSRWWKRDNPTAPSPSGDRTLRITGRELSEEVIGKHDLGKILKEVTDRVHLHKGSEQDSGSSLSDQGCDLRTASEMQSTLQFQPMLLFSDLKPFPFLFIRVRLTYSLQNELMFQQDKPSSVTGMVPSYSYICVGNFSKPCSLMWPCCSFIDFAVFFLKC